MGSSTPELFSMCPTLRLEEIYPYFGPYSVLFWFIYLVFDSTPSGDIQLTDLSRKSPLDAIPWASIITPYYHDLLLWTVNMPSTI
jgi:hypothetical protein